MADEDINKTEKKEEEIGSFYMGRMRPPPLPKRFLPPGVLTLFALAALGGIIWYAYPRGTERYTNLDVPVVKADTAPIKEKPENPGGMEVSHQDSTVFDPLQKNGGAEVEKIMPTPEQPMDKEQALKSEEIKPIATSPNVPPKLDMQVKQTAGGAEEIIPAAPEAKPPVEAAAPAPAAHTPAVTPAPKPEPQKVAAAEPTPRPEAKPEMKVEAKQEEEKPKLEAKKEQVKKEPAKIAIVKKEPVKKETAKDKPKEEKVAAGAEYEVQLGSYREPADAKKDWSRLEKKYATQLSGLKMRLVKADIPGKGIYYRMRAGVISKDKAHSICDALRSAHGVGCILAKK